MAKEITCAYCGDAFIPKRRFVQKYCCNSCRVLDFRKKKKDDELIHGLMAKALSKVSQKKTGDQASENRIGGSEMDFD
jgi:hypothetical protein